MHNHFRYRQGLLSLSQQSPVKPPLPVVAGPINIPTSPLAHHNYTWAQQSTVRVSHSLYVIILEKEEERIKILTAQSICTCESN